MGLSAKIVDNILADHPGSRYRSAMNPSEDVLKATIVFCWHGPDAPMTLSLPEQIAVVLTERIIAGSMTDGARIIEQDIAAEFGVSRAPIRETLRILEREGLIVLHPRRGCVVAKLSQKEVFDIFEIRVALYQVVSRHLAETRSPIALSAMERAIQRLELFAEDPKGGDQYAAIVLRLGLDMAQAANNPSLARMVASLALRTFRYSRIGLGTPQRRNESLGLWRGEYRAIRAGDIEKACRYATQRVERSCREALRIIKQEEAVKQGTPTRPSRVAR
jgi:DNA-binding GntR family transcriptional regulator